MSAFADSKKAQQSCITQNLLPASDLPTAQVYMPIVNLAAGANAYDICNTRWPCHGIWGGKPLHHYNLRRVQERHSVEEDIWMLALDDFDCGGDLVSRQWVKWMCFGNLASDVRGHLL